MKSILVTGGAGYIGSHCAKLIQKQGFHPVVIDNLSTGHKEFLKFGTPYIFDLLNKEKIREVFKSHPIEGVIHFAAFSLVGESVQNPGKYFNNNLQACVNLFDVMKEFNVTRLIISSSASVYGIGTEKLISENFPPSPISPYGESKRMMEKIASYYNFQTVCLRYFNVVGGDESGDLYEWHEPETHLIPNILKALFLDQPFTLHGNDYTTPDGTCIRDYVDVNDLVAFHLEVLKRLQQDSPLPHALNVGLGIGHSNLEIIKIVEDIFHKKCILNIGHRREGDPPILVADPSLARTHFPHFRFKTLAQSLHNVVKHFKPKVINY